VGDVLFEEPGNHFLGQGTGPFLALIEGNQLVLLVGIKHEFENGFGLLEPLLTETVAAGGAAVHESPSSAKARVAETQLAILPDRRSCKNGNGPARSRSSTWPGVACTHRKRSNSTW
jgi:hypothetical protein